MLYSCMTILGLIMLAKLKKLHVNSEDLPIQPKFNNSSLYPFSENKETFTGTSGSDLRKVI